MRLSWTGRDPYVCYKVKKNDTGDLGGFPVDQDSAKSYLGSLAGTAAKAVLNSVIRKGRSCFHRTSNFSSYLATLGPSRGNSTARRSGRIQDQPEDPPEGITLELVEGFARGVQHTGQAGCTDVVLAAGRGARAGCACWPWDGRRPDEGVCRREDTCRCGQRCAFQLPMLRVKKLTAMGFRRHGDLFRMPKQAARLLLRRRMGRDAQSGCHCSHSILAGSSKCSEDIALISDRVRIT